MSSICYLCNIDSDDLHMPCSICYARVHASCLGFRGPDVNKIMDHRGLNFYCRDCENVSPANLVVKFRKIQSHFMMLNKFHSSIYEIIGDERSFLFSNSSEVSVQTSPTPTVPVITAGTSAGRLTRSSASAVKRKGEEKVVPVVKSKKAKQVDDIPEIPELPVVVQSCEPMSLNVSRNGQIEDLSLDGASSQASGANFQAPEINVDNDFEALKPNKVVFLSNLPNTLPVTKIQSYLQKRIPSKMSTIHVHKMKGFETKRYSSFKIFVNEDDELFNMLVNKQFWPNNTFVREFFRRDVSPQAFD